MLSARARGGGGGCHSRGWGEAGRRLLSPGGRHVAEQPEALGGAGGGAASSHLLLLRSRGTKPSGDVGSPDHTRACTHSVQAKHTPRPQPASGLGPPSSVRRRGSPEGTAGASHQGPGLRRRRAVCLVAGVVSTPRAELLSVSTGSGRSRTLAHALDALGFASPWQTELMCGAVMNAQIFTQNADTAEHKSGG